jgi:hypothetical protein
MQDFSRSVTVETIHGNLLNALRGIGAFRNFKDTLQLHGIESDWFAFRADASQQIALDWCEENTLAWE